MRLLLLLLLLGPAQEEGGAGSSATGLQGAVAAGAPESVAAGIRILKAGGNAVDAAVATLLALSVTDSTMYCFGGEVPILVYDAKRKVVEVIAGQGVAPNLATLDHFEKSGGIPTHGIQSAAVPAALDACLVALDRHGTKSFAEVAAPTLALLDLQRGGWTADLAGTIRRLVDAEKAAEGDRAVKLRAVADCFYRGPIAQEIDAWSRENGGLLRAEDLAAHVTRVEEPVWTVYRGHTIYKCGPWTQGPCLLESLQLLEGFDLRAKGWGSPDAVHLTVEALKLGLADRDVHYADPRVEAVPLAALLSKDYADLRRPLIDPLRASREQRPGDPLRHKALLDPAAVRAGLGGNPRDTTTCLTADRWGNVVAATPSGWSGVCAGKTGVWLGSRLQSFNSWKGHPNCIAPGKRPRITLTPTLILKDGAPVAAISVAGGDGQDQVTLQVLTNMLDFDLPPDQAVTAPRWLTGHYTGSFGQSRPKLGSLMLQDDLPASLAAAMKARGHDVTSTSAPLWWPVALRRDPKTGVLHAAGDPKAQRHAAAW